MAATDHVGPVAGLTGVPLNRESDAWAADPAYALSPAQGSARKATREATLGRATARRVIGDGARYARESVRLAARTETPHRSGAGGCGRRRLRSKLPELFGRHIVDGDHDGCSPPNRNAGHRCVKLTASCLIVCFARKRKLCVITQSAPLLAALVFALPPCSPGVLLIPLRPGGGTSNPDRTPHAIALWLARVGIAYHRRTLVHRRRTDELRPLLSGARPSTDAGDIALWRGRFYHFLPIRGDDVPVIDRRRKADWPRHQRRPRLVRLAPGGAGDPSDRGWWKQKQSVTSEAYGAPDIFGCRACSRHSSRSITPLVFLGTSGVDGQPACVDHQARVCFDLLRHLLPGGRRWSPVLTRRCRRAILRRRRVSLGRATAPARHQRARRKWMPLTTRQPSHQRPDLQDFDILTPDALWRWAGNLVS